VSSSTFDGVGVAVTPGTVAPVGGRVLAFIIDGLVAGIAYGIGFAIAATTDDATIALLIPLVLVSIVGIGQWVAESFTGATAGAYLLGYRTLAVRDGRPAGLLAILLRMLVVAAGALACAVGQFVVVASGAWDNGPAQRGWHDKAAGTLVLRASALKPRRPGGAGAWNQAVERAIGTPPAPAPVPAPRTLPVVPPMPSLEPSAAPPAPLFIAADEPTRAPEPAPEPAPPQPLAPVRPRGGPVASAYLERIAAAESAADDVPVLAETRAAHDAAQPVSPPQPAPAPQPALPAPTGPAPLITGFPGQASVPPVPRAQDLGELEYTRLRDSVPTDRQSVLRLVFDTGQRIDVTGDGLVGRSPEGEMGIVHVVVIDDPDRSVSKVHIAFGLTPAGDELWVVDRASVNGTVLVDPDGVAATLPPGTQALVGAGWTIRFGQRSARVERR
jgi:uncharacterized RDD family membrane protein YckC